MIGYLNIVKLGDIRNAKNIESRIATYTTDGENNAPVAVRGEMFGCNKFQNHRTFKNEFIAEPYLGMIVHKTI